MPGSVAGSARQGDRHPAAGGSVYGSQEQGFIAVRLEVVDTNPEARRLYVREGFVCVKTDRIPLARHFAGFSAQDVMIKQLS